MYAPRTSITVNFTKVTDLLHCKLFIHPHIKFCRTGQIRDEDVLRVRYQHGGHARAVKVYQEALRSKYSTQHSLTKHPQLALFTQTDKVSHPSLLFTGLTNFHHSQSTYGSQSGSISNDTETSGAPILTVRVRACAVLLLWLNECNTDLGRGRQVIGRPDGKEWVSHLTWNPPGQLANYRENELVTMQNIIVAC